MDVVAHAVYGISILQCAVYNGYNMSYIVCALFTVNLQELLWVRRFLVSTPAWYRFGDTVIIPPPSSIPRPLAQPP